MQQIVILITRNIESTGCEFRFAVAPFDSERYPIDALVRSEIFTDRSKAREAAAERNRGIGPFDPGTEYPVIEAVETQCTFGALVLGDYIARMQDPCAPFTESFTLESATWSAAEIAAIHDWVVQVSDEFRDEQREGRPGNFRFARNDVPFETAAFATDRDRAQVHTEQVSLVVEHAGTTSEVTAGFDWFESA